MRGPPTMPNRSLPKALTGTLALACDDWGTSGAASTMP